MIDLRSDTVTRPTPAMRRAMAEADVGDDAFREDPTVRQLEERVADLLGKADAVFVPSGVMGNQIALRLHTQPGDEVVVPERSHVFHYEGGGPAALSGVQLRPIGDLSGIPTVEEVINVVRGAYDWEPRTTLLWLENTVNKAGGRVVPLPTIAALAEAARKHGLALHLDGARLWNAAVALGSTPAALAAAFDTVNVCLSKGLGAPIGSLLAGSREQMTQARRVRKLFGGGMRQVGVIAAAASIALDDFERDDYAMLRADHRRARAFADALDSCAGVRQVTPPDTNIVLFDTRDPAEQVIARLEAEGVRAVQFGPYTVRATFHRDVDDAALETALSALETALA